MKRKKKFRVGILSVALTMVMTCASLPATVLAEEEGSPDTNGLPECHQVHDDDCGYAEAVEETLCTHSCEVCRPEKKKLTSDKARTVSKRTICLDVHTSDILDKDANMLTPTDGVYDMLASEGWKWDTNTNTLTLQGLDVNASNRCAILFPPNTTIELIGSNSAVSGDSIGLQMDESTGVMAGKLTITGTGSLNIKSEFASITSSGDIEIKNASIDATSSEESAIWAKGALKIGGSADIITNAFYCGLIANGSGITIDGATVQAKSSDANAIFTDGTLQIGGKADLSATGGKYCALNSRGNMTIGESKINAVSPNDAAIYTPGILTVNSGADITATGLSFSLLANKDVVISGGKVVANSAGNAICSDKALSIGGTADVTAVSTSTTEGMSGLISQGEMTINGGKVNATSKAGNGIFTYDSFTAVKGSDIVTEGFWCGVNAAGNMTLNGKLQAKGNESTAIMSTGSITVGADADISASSVTKGGMFGTKSITTSGIIDAQGGGNSGIISYGPIKLNGGKIHAKGAPDTAAIFSYVQKTGNEAAGSLITTENLIEKNGRKISFSDWADHNGAKKSWTSFIAKDAEKLNTKSDGSMSNAVNEIWLDAPYTVTFDINGGSGTNSTVKVYPGNKVSAPKTNPSKDNCHFSGWYLDSTKFDFENTTINKDITIKANLEEHTPNADDGDCTTAITCSVCSEITTAAKTHVWDTNWTSDSSSHWYKCNNSGCTKSNSIKAHTPGEAATAEHSQVCTVCNYEIAPKLPSKNTIVDNLTKITVEYENGTLFDGDVILNVVSKPQAEMDKFKTAVEKAAPGFVLGGLFDVKMLKNGIEIQPGGKVKVSIPLTDKMKAMTDLKVVYIDENGNVTIMPSEIKDGRIVFTTDHFSDYGVIGKEGKVVPGTGNGVTTTGNTAQTGDNRQLLLLLAIFLISGCAATAIFVKRARSRRCVS